MRESRRCCSCLTSLHRSSRPTTLRWGNSVKRFSQLAGHTVPVDVQAGMLGILSLKSLLTRPVAARV